MNLAICDESTKFLNAFRVELYKLNPEISLACYTDYEKLASALEIIDFDAIIINTEINQESGIDFAAEMVQKNPNLEVIFVANTIANYSQAIFSHADILRPFALLVKPVSRAFMHSIIKMLETSLKNNCRSTFVVKISSREIITLHYSEIKYVEYSNRISTIHTDTDVIKCRKSISFFDEILSKPFFCMPQNR